MNSRYTPHPVHAEADFRASLKQAEAFFEALDEPDTDSEDGGPAALLEQVQCLAHSRVAQARHLHQLHDFDVPFVQSDDLLALFSG